MVDRFHRHNCGNGIAYEDRRLELNVLTQINAARTRESASDDRGDQRCNEHTVGNPFAKPGGLCILLINVNRVEVACDAGKDINVRLGNDFGNLCSVAYLQIHVKTVL